MATSKLRSKAKPAPVRQRVRMLAFELLSAHPQGLRYSDLHQRIREAIPELDAAAVNESIWNLDAMHPGRVYKAAKGVFRLVAFRDAERKPTAASKAIRVRRRVREEVFYPLFAHWLKNEFEDVTHAIALGGNEFKDRWGTPDVIAKSESRRSDVIKGPTSIISAEIKADANGLVTGFGQACAYMLFSHKTYLVIPQDASQHELERIASLCQIFGIGLVTFNARDPAAPQFLLVIRPRKHEPDLVYTNRYVSRVEKDLFQ